MSAKRGGRGGGGRIVCCRVVGVATGLKNLKVGGVDGRHQWIPIRIRMGRSASGV